MDLKNVKDIKGFIEFNHGCDKVLKDTLKEFFSSDVYIIDSPLVRLKEHSIDVADKPKRNLYILDNDTVFLLCYVEDDNVRYYLGIEICAKNISTFSNPQNLNPRLFHITANAISNALEEARESRFRKCVILLNDNLIKRIITKYLTPGNYNRHKIYFLIERFIAIRDTTFEGKYFSTGLIVSKSKHLYEKLPEDKCTLLELNASKNIFAPVDRRF